MNRYEVLAFIGMIVLLACTIFFVHKNQEDTPAAPPPDHQNQNNDKENNNEDNKTENDDDSKKDVYWGVDSASYTDESLYQCVVDNFGKPKVWGRYLGEIEGVSEGLDKDEVKYLHENDAHILVIYNHFSDATGHDHGVEEAEKAISLAKELDIPKGVAIFGDIEPDYPVDQDFMNGWYKTIASSPYTPGLYGVFNEDSELFTAFSQTEQKTKENTILWTAYPQKEITSKSDAPEFKPNGPDGSKLFGWQYAIDAETCNIDTNLFLDEMIEFLWKKK